MKSRVEAAPALAHAPARLSAFYAASFLVAGIQLPFWPVWLAGRGLDANEIGIVLAAALWAKVIATPAAGALADWQGQRPRVMTALAGIALAAYGVLWSAVGFGALLVFNLIASTAQSTLMPIGNGITLAAMRTHGIDYGRVRLWGSASFIAAALGAGALLTTGAMAATSDRVLLLVAGASLLLLLTCLGLPSSSEPADRSRLTGIVRLAADKRFWLFVLAGSALQASHQMYYGFGTLYWRRLGLSDAVIGGLWAEGVVAEIVLFWHGDRLVRRIGPLGLMVLGGAAGIVRWSLSGILPWLPAVVALQLLHAFTFGATHLGAMHYMARTVPVSAAASAQSFYAAFSAGAGGGLVMLAAGALYAAYGGQAYWFMALLSAAGLGATLWLARWQPAQPSAP